MAQPSSLASNNPFRRKAAIVPSVASVTAVPVPTLSPAVDGYPPETPLASASIPSLPSSDLFRSQLQSLGQQSTPPPPATSFQKPKVVKKVRVQSPPPSSPESAGVPDGLPPAERDSQDDSTSSDDDDESRGPFGYVAPVGATDGWSKGVQLSSQSHGPPPNPFQKTLQNLELGQRDVEHGSGAVPAIKGSLDVDAFRRLLLTGQAGNPGSSPAAASSPGLMPAPILQVAPSTTFAGDGASTADTSSVSRQSIFDAAPPVQDTPRTSHEISEPEIEDDQHGLIGGPRPKLQPPTTLRKKPPPPSSRHGKLIKPEVKAQDRSQTWGTDGVAGPSSSLSNQLNRSATSPLASPSRLQQPASSNVNKPLPPAPEIFFSDDVAESIFDREAAGKIPELDVEPEVIASQPPRPPTPPNASLGASTATGASSPTPKKPPPPPRRQPHGRPESRISTPASTPAVISAAQQDDTDQSMRRSSLDSVRSRSSSLRVSVHAPAPPPPRRPAHASRASSSFASPSATGFLASISGAQDRSPLDTSEFSPLPGSLSSPSDKDTEAGNAGGQPVYSVVSIASSSDIPNLPTPPSSHSHISKLSPPPPPPARNASVRSKRPSSVSSFDATSRRVGGRAKDGSSASQPSTMAPPPPPRARGSSRSSVDGQLAYSSHVTVSAPPPLPPAARRTSVDSVRILSETLAEEPGLEGGEEYGLQREVQDATAVNDILADLTALQREVDALRGEYEKVAPSG
ncbi:hypothetical protein B0T26DRAFT_353572 [Lasiosphaeria miniovina]|uniref:Uncharacterized protein n=1 Tax=Lasiosphaeria miniovina TaxID=1954250 RepID=A0AA40ABY5_9PEZI|nr:uncharacterized protein B0T26DRAFT_353572 [Lasiosphaeria miniovina]KAK0713056.1 hypothetical protein B0T26DRAFT_353572 [Lasiosphaeria miniovina]